MSAPQRLVGLDARPASPRPHARREDAVRPGPGRHRAPTFCSAVAAELRPDGPLAFACAVVLSAYTLADLAIALTGGPQ